MAKFTDLSIGTDFVEVLEKERNLTYLIRANLSHRYFLTCSYCAKWTAYELKLADPGRG